MGNLFEQSKIWKIAIKLKAMTIKHFPNEKKIYILDPNKLSIASIDQVARRNKLKDYRIEEVKNPGVFKGFLYKLKY